MCCVNVMLVYSSVETGGLLFSTVTFLITRTQTTWHTVQLYVYGTRPSSVLYVYGTRPSSVQWQSDLSTQSESLAIQIHGLRKPMIGPSPCTYYNIMVL